MRAWGSAHRCCMAVVSSCREVSGQVPQRAKPSLPVRSLWRDCRRKPEEGGMTSSRYGPQALGDTHATMAGTTGCHAARRSKSLKAGLSSDCRLQPACMKLELLVTAGQPYGGEYVPGPCTHRPSRRGSRCHLKAARQPVGTLPGGSRSGWRRQLRRSRNKVAVPEGAAGQPPFTDSAARQRAAERMRGDEAPEAGFPITSRL